MPLPPVQRLCAAIVGRYGIFDDEDEHIELVVMDAAETRRAFDDGGISKALSIITLERALARIGLRSV